jgi:hypothetical protein
VTHVVGLRPFGSQLLCEQVVGRALRRTSYAVDEATGFFREETAKVFWDTAAVLKRRIELMLALPMEALDSLSLQQQMREIGKR